MMRNIAFVVAAALLVPAVGCNFMQRWQDQKSRPTGKLPDASADDLVKFLNGRAAQLRSVEYDKVRVRVSGKDLPFPVALDGMLAAAQPRSFRLRASGTVAGSVDMGSNPELFWAHVFAPRQEPIVVAASHTDLETGRYRLPDGLPFEPDWVLQALGMTQLPTGVAYDVQPSDRDRTYTLGWTQQLQTGVTVRKEIVIDADAATGTRSQVKRHVLKDAKNKVIATAEIRAAEVHRTGQADAYGRPFAVQYPTHLVLQWVEPRFEMDLTLDRASVNSGLADDPARRGVFTRPAAPGRQ